MLIRTTNSAMGYYKKISNFVYIVKQPPINQMELPFEFKFIPHLTSLD